MFILKSIVCKKCEGDIRIVPCKNVVSYGECKDCGTKENLLPKIPFEYFTNEFCKKA